MSDSKFQRFFQICLTNLKISWLSNFGGCILLLLVISLFFDIENTDIRSAAKICEEYISMLGIVLLAPIFRPEQQDCINELMNTKSTMQVKVYIVRTVLSVITLFILTSVCVLTLKFFDGDFETMKFILGTFASGVSLGGVAILTNSICKFSVAGYTVAFGFWLYETTNKYKLIGYKFHILSLFRDSFTEKYYIFAAGIALITTSLIIRNFFRKGILG